MIVGTSSDWPRLGQLIVGAVAHWPELGQLTVGNSFSPVSHDFTESKHHVYSAADRRQSTVSRTAAA